ncbi:oxysterol-binding protein homolog 3 [Diutina catenulata]
MDEELLEIHSKDFLIKWFHADNNSIIDWQVTPQKKSINFAIYRKVEDATSGIDIKDSVDQSNEDSGRHRSDSVQSVSRVNSSLYRTKSRTGTFNTLNNTDLTLVKNYYKLLANESVHGKLEVQQGGMFAFVFDNSFSKTIAKKVVFSAKIEGSGRSSGAVVADDATDVGFEDIGKIASGKQGELLQGVLMKRKRKKLQGFTKRFFILSFKYGTLSYYKVNEKKLRGQMPIRTSMISADAKNREIIIDSGMEVWDVKAQSDEEFTTWVDAFNQIKSKKEWARAAPGGTLVDEEGTNYLLDELESIANKLDDLRAVTQDREQDLDDDVNDIYWHVCDLIDDVLDTLPEEAGSRDDEGKAGVVYIDRDGGDDSEYSDEYLSDEYDDDNASSGSESSSYESRGGLRPIDESDETDEYSVAESAGAGVGVSKAAGSADDADTSLAPLPCDPVSRNPDIPACDHQPPSILGFVRKNIGKDLSTIAMPVDMNEPLTILQKFAETFEYSDVVDNALEADDKSGERLLRITAFAVSYMSSQREKERNNRKPFNPLLGETFELVREDMGLRMVSEKVCHRPPVFAMYAETNDWTFSYSPSPNQTFWGKNAEIVTKGTAKLVLTGTGETFTWTQPSTLLKNIIAGEKYTEPSSELTVKSSSGQRAVVEFAKGGMFSGRSEDLTITAYDANKKELPYSVTGKWTESLVLKTNTTEKTIWQVGKTLQPPKKKFGFTEFAGTLNKITAIEDGKMAPTDSRLRPDLQVYERGEVQKAEDLKQKLEEEQRVRRKENEEQGKKHEPMYFVHQGGSTPDTGEWVYKTGPKSYWNRRANGDWDDVLQLF